MHGSRISKRKKSKFSPIVVGSEHSTDQFKPAMTIQHGCTDSASNWQSHRTDVFSTQELQELFTGARLGGLGQRDGEDSSEHKDYHVFPTLPLNTAVDF